MKKIYSVAIDGPSGAGKSTIAKILAEVLDINYLDTGAMYRMLAYAAKVKNTNIDDEAELNHLLEEVNLDIKFNGGEQINYLNGVDVSKEIRDNSISLLASRISAKRQVREKMAEAQRNIAQNESMVLDGRDIGTYVLPDAECKIFLTASPEVRAKRRVKQLEEKGQSVPYEQILDEIIRRDYADSHRELAPLKKADDAIEIDSTDLSLDETILEIERVIKDKIDK